MGGKSKGGGTGRGTGSKGWTRWNKTAKPVRTKALLQAHREAKRQVAQKAALPNQQGIKAAAAVANKPGKYKLS